MKPIQKKLPKNPIVRYNNLSEDQAVAKKVIDNNVITCLLGKAGCGKTYLAVVYALEKFALEKKNGGINKIIMTRPTVFRKEDAIGFLPGDMAEKLDPFLRPIYDIIEELEGVEKTNTLIKDKSLQICPLAYIQGRTFNDACIIVDESQNLSKEGVEMIYSRIGKNSKLIFCGDDKQSLIDVKETGFSRLIKVQDMVNGLASYELTTNFRNPIIEELLQIY